MNKKRLFYLLAFLVIIAAIIVPAVVNSSRTSSGPAAGTVEPGLKPESDQATTTGDNGTSVATRITAPATGSAGGQDAQSTSSSVVQSDVSHVKSPPEHQGCSVGIAVVGIDGKLLYPPATVTVNPNNKWGVTALGALDATGLPYAMKPMWPDFVDSICGQACKGVSGWMYMVNGEIPMHMSDKNPVKDGDKVIWWYSMSMDQTPPVWENLASGHS